MKKAALALSVIAALVSPLAAHAGGDASQKLGVCLTDSLNGMERKNLAKWIFFGLSAHSSIKDYTQVAQADIDASNQYIGGLITRLLTEDCPEIVRAAVQESGSRALEYAFGIVGQVAMQEIMTEQAVSASLGMYEQYLDQDKLNKVFQ